MSIILTTDQAATVTVDSDDLYIQPGVTIRSSSSTGVDSVNAGYIRNSGAILVTGEVAAYGMIVQGGTNTTVVNDALGSIWGTAGGVFMLSGTIINHGRISGPKGILGGPNSQVINTGMIQGSESDGIGVDTLGRVDNSGLISGTIGVRVRSTGGPASEIVNLGTIRGTSDAVLLDYMGKLTNHGLIVGDISASTDLFNSGQQITNTGTIVLGTKGLVLGGGDDVFSGRAGKLAGVLNLGSGNDTAYSGLLDDTVNGGNGNDFIDGGEGSDTALFTTGANITVDLSIATAQNTGEGNDRLISIENVTSGSGNDALTGNAGDNVLNGGDGNDTLTGGLGDDTLIGGAGTDTAVFNGSSAIIVVLNDDGTGTATGNGNDVLDGIENIVGSSASNAVTGNSFDNAFWGGAGHDTLDGAGGNDTLVGGVGKDVLTGGAGADVFVFNTGLNARTNLDTITDFEAGTDKIHLENGIFTKLTVAGALDATAFWVGAKAHDRNDRIIYNPTTGALMYDADGTGAKAAVKFAILPKGLTLTSDDFFII